LRDDSLAIRGIEHPLGERGGRIVRQQNVQCAGRPSSRPNTDLLPGMGVGGGNARVRRVKLLSYVAILPWVHVPRLASHLWSQLAGRLSGDWQAQYGHPIHRLESFVQPDRFAGTAYQSATWVRVGQTKGRSRQDRPEGWRYQLPIKDLYLCPLHPRFRELLRGKGNANRSPANSLIRERDDWGLTEQLRQQGKDHSRWHWVYMGTVFRLDHCGQTAGQRAFITQRGYVATRLGIEDLLRQLYREALEPGLGQAQDVLVLADGAVWIWNAFQDRFQDARQRLDLWHAEEHLWEVANDLYGKGPPEARAFVAPLLQQVRADQTLQVIQSLTDLKSRLQSALSEKVQRQIECFSNHKNRMNYKELIEARKASAAGKATPEQVVKAQEPLGSEAIESTCRQYQCRFKRTGQFWTTDGDEALMCLETFWRNDRWHVLYPHVNHLKRNLPALN
jgi:hypothetical protein